MKRLVLGEVARGCDLGPQVTVPRPSSSSCLPHLPLAGRTKFLSLLQHLSLNSRVHPCCFRLLTTPGPPRYVHHEQMFRSSFPHGGRPTGEKQGLDSVCACGVHVCVCMCTELHHRVASWETACVYLLWPSVAQVTVEPAVYSLTASGSAGEESFIDFRG